MTKILITGFTPFDGREVNGSWIAAQTFEDAQHMEIPVVWGEPLPRLRAEINRLQPEIVVSFGEGKQGQFAVETRAENKRKHRVDNNDQYPVDDIVPDGPSVIFASIDAQALCDRLAKQNINLIVSHDAGQFLCEETLYSLERLKQENENLKLVTFIHLPPYGTKVEYQGTEFTVDTTILKDFVQKLITAVSSLETLASHQHENHG